MTRNIVAIAAMLVVATMTGASLIAGAMLPEDIQLPIHWNISGEADRFGSKWVALLTPPGTAAAVSLLLYFLPSVEPRKAGLARSQGLYLWGWIAFLLMSGLIELVLLSTAFGWGLRPVQLIAGGLGVMLMLIGNQLGKSRSMYLMGIRTPWTLASEEVWIKTHRLSGKLMVGGGFAILAAALLPVSPTALAIVCGAAIFVSAGVPVLYSFIAWRRETRADQASG